MIVRMSKIEIIGLRQDLAAVLDTLWQDGHLHIDPATVGFIEEKERTALHSLLADQETALEKIYLTDLKEKILALLRCLPNRSVRESLLSPRPILDSIEARLETHLADCTALRQRLAAVSSEQLQLRRYQLLLQQLEGMLADLAEVRDVECIGLSFEGRVGEKAVRSALDTTIGSAYELLIDTGGDDGRAGLLVLEKSLAARVRKLLAEKKIPELSFPGLREDLPFADKLRFLRERQTLLEKEEVAINDELDRFAGRWGPLYGTTLEWIERRLSILRATSMVFESHLCFFVYGWLPAAEVATLRDALNRRFGPSVHLEVLEIRKSDLGRIPVLLKNPPVLQPFEKFTRLLPLPAYTSYDPTPFIAIFFPLFFGMILGDAGYGVILLLLSLWLSKSGKGRDNMLRDAALILRLCSLWAVVFGLLYAEVFGDLPSRLFGIRPFLVDRHHHIPALLTFALAVGFVHVLIGLALGAVAAWQEEERRKAAAKVIHILLIACTAALILVAMGVSPPLFRQPLLIAAAPLCLALLLTGGLLAPLELLKDIGNIVSYVRIMAIGLTSVLLAYVANRLSGAAGDVVLGLIIGGVLHLLNLVIGVFSSTIHSIRLHYVEFFDKFLDFGGRHYQPLHKEEVHE
ncbi:MAG: V-type ATPase 116kDa subunit family protein [Thermodesulfobacteriota bacterium]